MGTVIIDICRKHDWCPDSIDSEATYLAIVDGKDTENHVAACRMAEFAQDYLDWWNKWNS